MQFVEDPLQITAPFGNSSDLAQSARYSWDNSTRGKVAFVIIQKTLEGEGFFKFGGETLPVPPGYAFLALASEKSSYYYPPGGSEPWEFSWLNLYGSLATRLCADLRKGYGAVLPLPDKSTAGSLFSGLVAHAEQRSKRDPCDLSTACLTFLMEWKRLLDQPEWTRSDRMTLAKRICQTRFREPVGIKEIADQTGLTREHFTRLFTAATGVSPARYLRDLRVQAAREIMALQSIPLKEVALRCGFPSSAALHRAMNPGGK